MEQEKLKAATLIEALPYMQRFRGETVVIKYGGAAMENPDLVESVLRDIVFLEVVGINPVIVHGGGKAITRAMKESGLQATFVDGMRVSDVASMDIIERTLSQEINPSIVERINGLGGHARGYSGKDVFQVEKLLYVQESTGQKIDLGFVGEVTGVNLDLIREAVVNEMVPVISPIGQDTQGRPYNINADLAASAVARKLKVQKLIYLSDTDGVMLDPKNPESRISVLTPTRVDELKKQGVISGGMIPKVDSAVDALEQGVKQVHFLDGRIPHALLLEVFTDAGIGTEITSG